MNSSFDLLRKVESYLSHEKWYKPIRIGNSQLVPLRIDQYNELSDWDGKPYFIQNGKLVRPFEKLDKGKIDSVVRPIFINDIRYYAHLAANRGSIPLLITGTVLPVEGIIPCQIRCFAYQARENLNPDLDIPKRWFILTRLPQHRCEEIMSWDRLAVFEDEGGALVRPLVAYEQNGEPLFTKEENGDSNPCIVIEKYQPRSSRKAIFKAQRFKPTCVEIFVVEMKPLFRKKFPLITIPEES